MSEKNKNSFMMISLLGIIALVFAVLFYTSMPISVLALTRGASHSYSCASIHFGMIDNTQSATMEAFNKTSTNSITDDNKLNYYYADNQSLIDNITFNRCQYHPPIEVDNHTTLHPIKFGNSNSGSDVDYASINISFTANIIGFIIYFVPSSAGTSYTLDFNGSPSKTVYTKDTLSSSDVPSSDLRTIHFLSYEYMFKTPVSYLEIKGGAKTTQLYLGDIALRVA